MLRWEFIIPWFVLGMVVVAWTLDSVLDPVIESTDLNMVATMVARDMDAGLYPRDNLFANEELYRFYTPLYRQVIVQLWQVGGTFEAALAWLVPLVLSLYLAGMFFLLWRVSGNRWIALALTVASAHYHDTMGAGVWGVGGSAEMMPRTLFMPVIPLVMLLYLRILENPTWLKGAILGGVIGLFANLHPVSGLHFLALLSALLLLVHGFRYRGWQTISAIGLAAIVGVMPFGLHFVQNTGRAVPGDVGFDQFSRLVADRYPVFFFPAVFEWPLLNLALTRPTLDLLVWVFVGLALAGFLIYVWGRHRWPGLVRWGWLVGGLVSVAYAYMIVLFDSTFIFAVVALYLIVGFWRDGYSRLTGWLIALTGLVVLYAFVGYYILTVLWQTFELWALTSLLIEYARAARFVYLPIYLLAGLAGATLVEALARYLKGKTNIIHKPQIGWVVALVFALAPGVTTRFEENVSMMVLTLIGLIAVAAGVVLALNRAGASWGGAIAAIGLILITFGPLAPFVGRAFPVPTRNLWQTENLAATATNQIDAELYNYVLKNTSRDSLFYGCFGSVTMTHFRRNAERSITHNWKDLAYNVHNRATLLPAFDRFRTLESACRDFDRAIVAAHTLKTDYILVSSQAAAPFLHEACFVNEKYALFTLNPDGCPAGRVSLQ